METFQNLMQIKYRDSVCEVTTQFARVYAYGDLLPQDKLFDVYLWPFLGLWWKALKRDFFTWVEASEYLLKRN